MQVPMSESRNGRDRAGSYPSSLDAMIPVSTLVSNVRNPVKSSYEDLLVKVSRAADRQERDELVGMEPSSISRYPEFEGTINGMQVNFDTVQYAENIINDTMNASPYRYPDIKYLLSIGLQFSNRYPWNHSSIGMPIYRYNLQACQYDGGTITNFPTNQYPEPLEWINLSQYKYYVSNRTIEEKWPLVLGITENGGRFIPQSNPNDISAGRYYDLFDYSKNNLSSSQEFTLSTETVNNPSTKPNQLNSISMQSLHTQKNGSIATQAHIPSEPKPIKSQNIETKIIATKVSHNCLFEYKLRSKSKQAIAQALFSFSPPQNKDP